MPNNFIGIDFKHTIGLALFIAFCVGFGITGLVILLRAKDPFQLAAGFFAAIVGFLAALTPFKKGKP